jgi:hypothetical protein
MRGFISRLGETWSIIGITFFLLILVEVFFKIYLSFSSSTDHRTMADCYQGADWVPGYYSEFAECNNSRWEPYVYWKRKPYDGEFIQVDEEGRRKTTKKSHPLSKRQSGLNIHFYGGSAMWGTGARDAYTIPSLAGNELIRHGINPSLLNFGESGYVSSQEVTALISELKKGNIPDVVVFYDGVNDIFSAYQSGRAGIPQNESNRQKEFNALKEKKKSLRAFLSSLKTLSTIRFLTRKFGADQAIIPEGKVADLENLASQTAHHYNENIRLVNALAKEYGFYALFYWQPTLFDKPYRSEYEQAELDKAMLIQPFSEAVNNLLFTDDLTYEKIRFYNLSGVFNAVREPLFIDWCHVGENGNALISERMVRDMLPVIDSLKAGNDLNDE